MASTSAIILIILPIYHCFSERAYKKVAMDECNFYEAISNMDRKRWVAEEHYRRTYLGIKTISDSTY